MADARAQPAVVEHGHVARLGPAGRVRGLRARLAVLPRPGSPAPDARQLRQAQRALGREGQRAAELCSTSCCRWPPTAPAASRGSTTSPSTAAARRGSAGSPRAPPCRRSRAPPRGCTARPSVLPIAQRALGIFKKRTPTGVRVPAAHGDHYAEYSFAPSLRVLNGFIQSLVGLYDYARLTKDPLGTALFQDAEPQARAEVADVRHRRVVAVLARQLHARVDALLPRPARGLPRQPLHAHEDRRLLHAADHFVAYKTVPPVLTLHARACAAARTAACASTSRRSRPCRCGSRAGRAPWRRGRSAPSATASAASAGRCRARPARTRSR